MCRRRRTRRRACASSPVGRSRPTTRRSPSIRALVRPSWCRPTPPIRSARSWNCPTSLTCRPAASARPMARGSVMLAPDPSEAPAAPAPASARVGATAFWRRGFAGRLLYGNVDRAAKAKARVGLAILVFAAGYAVIAGRLVMFAAAPDSQLSRRTNAADAVATARPDVLDRNGETLATDVRGPSLFAEPHRIIDVDDAVELLTPALPDRDAIAVRKEASSKPRVLW